MTEKPEEIRIEDEAAKEEDLPLQEEESQEASQESEENAEAAQAEAEEPTEKAEEPEKEEKAEPEKDDTRYLRLLAEFQNYKKRTEKEKTDLYSYANEKIMTATNANTNRFFFIFSYLLCVLWGNPFSTLS